MLILKLFLTASTIVMLISVFLSVGFPSVNHSGDDDVEVIPINGGAVGPESFDFDPVDGIYPFTGVSDGRIIKWIESERRWTDFAVTSPHRDHVFVVLTGDKTGSLLKYNIGSKEVTVVLHNLTFPNGVALSKDGNFLLVAETTTCRILRLWLKTPKAGTLEVFTELPGYPDNIKINTNGEFWVGMYSRKKEILNWVHSYPWIETVLSKLPLTIVKASSYIIAKVGGEGLAAKLGADGDILEILEDVNGKTWKYASEVMEKDGYLWIGSVENPFAVKLKVQE
ncbi:hypothetical protein E3N88_34124 [Mikania micrantha]|uniref:Strictosidine synthase conserved region domain-containing protein n=1 Tax=Mikania micrantha TaxID=192012 RepID=A0A5N6MDY4_9ASTR|nr:hypothetical protein E3N88_34124 [Mikania micrantha]